MRSHAHRSFVEEPISWKRTGLATRCRLSGIAVFLAAAVAPNAFAEVGLAAVHVPGFTQQSVRQGSLELNSTNARTTVRAQGIAVDQKFLRLLADHYEGMRTVAHDRMMDAGGHAAHGKQNDPASLDGESDMLQTETLKLLSTLYHDEYSARPAKFILGEHGSAASSNDAQNTRNQKRTPLAVVGPNLASGVSSGVVSEKSMSPTETTTTEASHEKARAETAARFRDTIAAIDSFHGKLRRNEVKELAARHRVLLEDWLGELGAGSQPE